MMLQVIEVYDGLLKAGADPAHVLCLVRDHRRALLSLRNKDNFTQAIEQDLDPYIKRVEGLVRVQETVCL